MNEMYILERMESLIQNGALTLKQINNTPLNELSTKYFDGADPTEIAFAVLRQEMVM